jgi:phenylacetate-CoA ligase
VWCYGFWGFGIRPTDTVFFAFSYGSFIGFWGAHYCCEKMGCLVLPSGNMTTERASSRSSRWAPRSSAPRRPTRCAWRRTAQKMGIDLRARQGER